jgi:Protein of unknown function (DUF1236)
MIIATIILRVKSGDHAEPPVYLLRFSTCIYNAYTTLGPFMKSITRHVGVFVISIILYSSAGGLEAQPSTEPAIPPRPRLTLTAEQEYIIREIVSNEKVTREKVATETVGDSIPENVKLHPLPAEVEQKVPQTRAHEYFVEDDDTIVLVSPSDRRIADVLKKKSGG